MRRILRIVLILAIGVLLHYVMPQKDVARVTGISDRIETLSWIQRPFYAQVDAGAEEGTIRDLRLINTERRKTWLFGLLRTNNGIMVYRNEDTGWIWPPYFKFDSSNLEAEAQALVAKSDQWVQITHYGWRIPFLSIYPNAIAIKEVDGPTYRPIPWFNIGFFIFVVFAFFMIRAMWRQFRERKLDPALDDVGNVIDRADARMSQTKGRFAKWWRSWRGPDSRS